MKLTKTQIECLKEISAYDHYPSYWKPKTREKLESLGLVQDRNQNQRFCPAEYQLTDAGKEILKKYTAA
ncbi:hypothetical protein SMY61_003225 [Cronobacter sakazakii]|nr:hypothetical protein [Cronobacter sakazakii]ELY4364589.1 hypothetical protein [Cronobacter sakazakii]KAB0849121.1 hypothetical protein FZI10_11925 [Cronobacter sakazakii]